MLRNDSGIHVEKWNSAFDVFGLNEEAFNKQKQANEDYYRARKKTPPLTIGECITDALQEGNHVRFAQMFIHRDEWKPTERFVKWYSSLREDKGINLHEIVFVKTLDWRNPLFSCGSIEDWDVSKAMKSRWIGGHDPVPRDNLVQLALYLGYDSDAANELLWQMGERCLYPLDVVDAVEMFYLDFFHAKEQKPDNSKLTYLEKLDIVKKEINEMLLTAKKEGLEWVGVSKRGKKGGNSGKESKVTDDNGQEPEYAVRLIHDSKIGINIKKELEELQEAYGEELDYKELGIPAEHTLTMFLTKFFEERLKHAGSVRSYFNPDDLRKPNVFTERYYGFLKRTLDYLYDWKKYEKNLRPSGWTFAGNVGYLESVQSERRNAEYDKAIEKALAAFAESETGRDTKEGEEEFRKKYYEKCMRLVHYIETMDWLEKNNDSRFFNPGVKNPFTVTRQYIEGEEVKVKDVKWSLANDGSRSLTIFSKEMKKLYRVKELKNKKSIMEYAIATGHEEGLGDYLRLAGYWKEDWYLEIAGKEVDDLEKSGGFEPDRLDALFLYAMVYRDRLIDEYCSLANDGQDTASLRERMVTEFPMRELLTAISRDISYVYTVCEYDICEIKDDRKKGAVPRSNREKEAEKQYKAMRKNMLFPIKWSTKEELYSFNRDENPHHVQVSKECI